MNRREIVAGLGAIPACRFTTPAHAQPRPSAARVGFLHPRLAPVVEALRLAALGEGLRAAPEGAPVEIVVRVADGSPEQLQAFAAELAAGRVDVILAVSAAGVAAARVATATIPIVAVDLETDPVASGLVQSLSRPGGNVTGVFLDMPELSAKCLQLLAEAVPGLAKVGILWDPTTGSYQLRLVEAAAVQRGHELVLRSTSTFAEVDEAFASVKRERAGAAFLLSSPLFAGDSRRVAGMTSKHSLPTITLFPEFARNGGLMAYGPDLQSLFRQAGAVVLKVLRGAKPADLPVERPTRFELVVHAGTARRLGLDLPVSILARADEVIE